MKVLLVGAGFSGVGAARTLLEEGGDVQVIVLEAGDRVGGRACTNGRREMGGTYWHGIYGHPLYEYALKQHITQPPHTRDFRWGFVQPGKLEPVGHDASDSIRKSVHAYGSTLAACGSASTDACSSIGGLLQKTFNEQGGHDEGGLTGRAWRWRELVTRIASGAEASADISAAWWAGAEDLGGPNIPCPIGFQGLAEAMAEGLDIRYGARATKVCWGDGGATVSCSDGRRFTADAVIMTVSLGVLKATHTELFEPPLPKAKVAAMGGLTIGTVDKLFLDFSGNPNSAQNPPAWGDPPVAYHLLWDREWDAHGCGSACPGTSAEQAVPDWARGVFSVRFGGSEFKAPSQTATHNATSNGCSGGQANGDAHTDSPPEEPGLETYTGSARRVYGNSSRETGWTAQQHAAAGLPTPWAEHPTGAVLWITGEHARAMEACSQEEAEAGVAALLAAFPAIPCPPGQPWRLQRSAWGSDPLFRGSYSYVNARGSPADIDTLAQPLTVHNNGGERPVVLFAGEATHRQLTGTMGGAFMTGQREARRLIKAWSMQQPLASCAC